MLGASSVEVRAEGDHDERGARLVQVHQSVEEASSACLVRTEREHLLQLVDDRSDGRAVRTASARAPRPDPSRASSPRRVPRARSAVRRDEPGTDERGLPAPRRPDHGHEAAFEESGRGWTPRPPRVRRTGLRPPARTPSARGRGTSPARGGIAQRRARRAPTLGGPVGDAGPRTSARPISGGSRPSIASAVRSSIKTCPRDRPAPGAATARGCRLVPRTLPARGSASPVTAATRASNRPASSRAASKPSWADANADHQRPVVDGRDAVAPVRTGDLAHRILRALRAHGLTSASTSVTVPLGRAAPHQRCSLRDEGGRPTHRDVAGIGGQVRAHDPLQRRDPLALDRAPARRAARREARR